MRSEVSFAFAWKGYLQFRIIFLTYFFNLKSTMITIKSILATILMLSTADGFFVPHTKIISSHKFPTSSPRRILTGSSPTNLSADVTFAIEKLPSMSKNIVIVLAFGGGESVQERSDELRNSRELNIYAHSWEPNIDMHSWSRELNIDVHSFATRFAHRRPNPRRYSG